MRSSKSERNAVMVAAFGLGLCAAGAVTLWLQLSAHREGSVSSLAPGVNAPSFLPRVSADLEVGDYEFFPNRRSIWVVNRTNGRMATYHFHDDELGSVDRSRIAQLDLKTFPRADTIIKLSDRNLNNVLWVCNGRTGDVQMWSPARDGTLRGETPIATSTDLIERAAGARAVK